MTRASWIGMMAAVTVACAFGSPAAAAPASVTLRATALSIIPPAVPVLAPPAVASLRLGGDRWSAAGIPAFRGPRLGIDGPWFLVGSLLSALWDTRRRGGALSLLGGLARVRGPMMWVLEGIVRGPDFSVSRGAGHVWDAVTDRRWLDANQERNRAVRLIWTRRF